MESAQSAVERVSTWLLPRRVSNEDDHGQWMELVSAWVTVILGGGFLIYRWVTKLLYPAFSPGALYHLQAWYPSFTILELQGFLAAHGGDAEAAGKAVDQQILAGELRDLIEFEVHKEDSTTLFGCTMTGRPSALPCVSAIAPGSLVADNGTLRIGDTICRVNGEVAIGVQTAKRLLADVTGAVRLQIHRRPTLIPDGAKAHVE